MLTAKQLENTESVILQIKSLAKTHAVSEEVVVQAMALSVKPASSEKAKAPAEPAATSDKA